MLIGGGWAPAADSDGLTGDGSDFVRMLTGGGGTPAADSDGLTVNGSVSLC